MDTNERNFKVLTTIVDISNRLKVSSIPLEDEHIVYNMLMGVYTILTLIETNISKV